MESLLHQFFCAGELSRRAARRAWLKAEINWLLTVAELRDLEVRNIQAALKRTSGKIYGDDGAAALLVMKPTTLVSRIKSLGLNR